MTGRPSSAARAWPFRFRCGVATVISRLRATADVPKQKKAPGGRSLSSPKKKPCFAGGPHSSFLSLFFFFRGAEKNCVMSGVRCAGCVFRCDLFENSRRAGATREKSEEEVHWLDSGRSRPAAGKALSRRLSRERRSSRRWSGPLREIFRRSPQRPSRSWKDSAYTTALRWSLVRWPLQNVRLPRGSDAWTDAAGNGSFVRISILAKETVRRWLSFRPTKSVSLLVCAVPAQGNGALWYTCPFQEVRASVKKKKKKEHERGVAAASCSGRRRRQGISRSERAQPEMDTLGAHEWGHGRRLARGKKRRKKKHITPVNTEASLVAKVRSALLRVDPSLCLFARRMAGGEGEKQKNI